MLARLMPRIASLILASALLTVGCDNGPTPTDAPLADAPVLEPSYLFGPCVSDAQCEHLGEGAICREAETGPTEGYCTVPCDDRTPCDAFGRYHHCLTLADESQSYCVPQCRNGADCVRDSWTCDPQAGPTGDDGVCVSVCETDAECGGTAVCNPESSRCEAPPVDLTGAAHGEPCAGPTDCTSGFCVTEGTAAQPSGWVGGMCVGICRVPDGFNSTNFYEGDTLPRGGCVEGAVCIPGAQMAAGDLGTCYRECTSTADCRPGYGCLQTLLRHTFTNGICVPADCRSPSNPCPTGYRCATVALSDGSMTGRCAPL
jgi:hypothetical protein